MFLILPSESSLPKKKKKLLSLYCQSNYNIHRLEFKMNLFFFPHLKATTSILSRWLSVMSLAPLSLFKAFNLNITQTQMIVLRTVWPLSGCRLPPASRWLLSVGTDDLWNPRVITGYLGMGLHCCGKHLVCVVQISSDNNRSSCHTSC